MLRAMSGSVRGGWCRTFTTVCRVSLPPCDIAQRESKPRVVTTWTYVRRPLTDSNTCQESSHPPSSEEAASAFERVPPVDPRAAAAPSPEGQPVGALRRASAPFCRRRHPQVGRSPPPAQPLLSTAGCGQSPPSGRLAAPPLGLVTPLPTRCSQPSAAATTSRCGLCCCRPPPMAGGGPCRWNATSPQGTAAACSQKARLEALDRCSSLRPPTVARCYPGTSARSCGSVAVRRHCRCAVGGRAVGSVWATAMPPGRLVVLPKRSFFALD